MISVVRNIDPSIATGILARAALALDSNGSNPGARYVVQDEEAIRRAAIYELRTALGLPPHDESGETIARLCDALDAEVERLASPPDISAAEKRLSVDGHLPSELYEVQVVPNVSQNLGSLYNEEHQRIVDTVHAPNVEQHFGAPVRPGEPHLLSLFAREYRDKFPYRNFILLVVGQRDGLRMVVHQAWRVYESQVDLAGVSTLIEMLERFADVYGHVVSAGGRSGKFMYSVEVPLGTDPESAIKVEAKPGTTAMLSHFWQRDPITGRFLAALVVAINVVKYRKLLKSMHAV